MATATKGHGYEGRKQGYGMLPERTAGECQFHVPRVDEQVNKAVTAANRAATAARVAAVKAVQNRMDGKFCETTDV
ncbi:hypothetical protein CK203_012561 [Vitis vinifera]|uniref:Uncharacterized protein n=1 Tax=Vitis vinifera TaxID=29760 RepID=A0A438KMQ6_VITVI|nr:hypothetical protein CK203_012561 [Vitis vinifera]